MKTQCRSYRKALILLASVALLFGGLNVSYAHGGGRGHGGGWHHGGYHGYGHGGYHRGYYRGYHGRYWNGYGWRHGYYYGNGYYNRGVGWWGGGCPWIPTHYNRYGRYVSGHWAC